MEKGSFGAFWFLLGALCVLGVLALLVYPFVCVQGLGLKDVPLARQALWAEVGGGRIFVTSGECAGQHKKMPVKFVRGFVILVISSCTCQLQWGSPVSIAFMHVWFLGLKVAFRRNCRQGACETSFSPNRVCLFSRNSRVRFWDLIVWHFGVGRATHPGPALPVMLLLRHSMLVVGFGHGDLALEARVYFLAVVEHR